MTRSAVVHTDLPDSDAAGTFRARSQIGGWKPQLAIFFGFSTCGQVVRCEGEFNGFQNCTAVVCIIPE
jgi:hypothetical protein